jgi:type i restriction enzyme ecoR124II specificity protein
VSRIDDLIRDLCPDGVEHKLLKDLVRIKNGRDFKHLKQGDIPVYGSGGVISYVNESASEGPSVLIPRKGSLNKLYFVEGPFWTVDTIFYTEISNQLEPKYFYYYLQTLHLEKMNQAGGVPSLTQRALNELHIPTPPILIQREIARALDQFTQLEAELEAELEARQQQYAHYRNILVAPRSPKESVKLGEVSYIARGASPRPIRKFITNEEGMPWIKIGDVPPQGKYVTTTAQHISTDGVDKSRQIKPGDFILSNSMSFGRPYISKINGCIHDGWLVIANYEKTFDPDFLYHVLRSSPIQNGFAQRAGSGTVKNLNSKIVSDTLVPAPPIDQQREIVHLLDKFDLLVNDLTSGLPAEIEARRKQYEYYRDRLLTFPEKK